MGVVEGERGGSRYQRTRWLTAFMKRSCSSGVHSRRERVRALLPPSWSERASPCAAASCASQDSKMKTLISRCVSHPGISNQFLTHPGPHRTSGAGAAGPD